MGIGWLEGVDAKAGEADGAKKILLYGDCIRGAGEATLLEVNRRAMEPQ